MIDTPPALSDTIHTAIASADLVIIPVRPTRTAYGRSRWSSMSSRALESLCICDQWCHTWSTIALDAVRALAQHGKVAPSILHHRIDFATSMIDGRTVGGSSHKSRSAHEVTDLWVYVKTQLRKVRWRT